MGRKNAFAKVGNQNKTKNVLKKVQKKDGKQPKIVKTNIKKVSRNLFSKKFVYINVD